jgi:hypothetical protein
MPFRFNPLTGKLDIVDVAAPVPPADETTFVTDAGNALSVADSINVFGGTGIATSGAGDTVTISLTTPVAVTNGGTGTSTAFTQGSVVFADGAGVYAQDNANLFWDDTNNRLGIDNNSPQSPLDVKGGISAGSYGGTNAAPTNGMIISGQFGIGTSTVGANNQLQINPSTSHGVSVQGTMSVVDGGNNQHGFNNATTFAPAAGSTISSSYEGTAVFAAPVGQTIANAVSFHSSPSFTGNAGTITTGYGFWYDGGGAGAGTITTAYGAFFAAPTAGTTKIPLYAASATFGVTGTAAPANGLLVNGAIRNSNLTARGVVYANASQDLTSVALTNGQLLIGSTGADPVAATLTAGTNISITNGAGSITINASGGLTWQTISANQALVANNGYACISPGGALSLSLPATAAVGTIIRVMLAGATSFTITQAAGQQVFMGNTNNTLGATGTTASTAQGDSVELLCTVANTTWYIISSVGNINLT